MGVLRTMSDTKRKICYEELFDKYKLQAERWIEETPEVRSLFLLVDWSVGKNDFPPVHVVSKDELTEESVLAAMTQTLKLLEMLTKTYYQQINKNNSVLRKAQSILEQHSSSPIADSKQTKQ